MDNEGNLSKEVIETKIHIENIFEKLNEIKSIIENIQNFSANTKDSVTSLREDMNEKFHSRDRFLTTTMLGFILSVVLVYLDKVKL